VSEGLKSVIGRRLARVVGAVERRLWPGSPVILIYHRLGDPGRDIWGVTVSPERFAEQIDALTSVRRVVGLGELVRRSRSGGRSDPPLAAVTFDDGYHDAFSLARPILRRLDCPATVFVAAGLVDAAREFWWDELEFILLEHEPPPSLPADLAGAKRPIDLPDRGARLGACHRLRRQFRDLPPEAIETRLAGLRVWAGVPRPAREARRAMTAAEVAELDDGLLTVGAHTMSHPSLPRLTPQRQSAEIEASRRRCEAMTGGPVAHFAYPFGHYDAASLAATRAAGFETACATTPGVVRPTTDPYRLPRLAPGQMDGEALLRRC
jgi:peptidoglycan/xylan/chitin deacetylase (PgdA/CDA1 family)